MDRPSVRIPRCIDDINLEWFDAVLEDKVAFANVVDVIHGTATKIRVDVGFAEGRTAARTQTVWVKTGLEPHSKAIGTEKVYAGETFFYRNFGGRFETRTPDCLFADSDDDGNSVIVLDDLCKQGAWFADPLTAGSPDLIARGLEAIARYQAASWMNPELYAVDWLRQGGSFDAADCLAWIYDEAHWAEYSRLPRFQHLAPPLRDRDLLLKAHTSLRRDWLRREPWALSHGDAHFGQLYSLPSGEARLLDWQCVQVANYMQDPANLIVSGLTVEDRRRCARDLVAHYVAKLGEFGVETPPTLDAAYEALRAYALHQLSWAMCMVEMQPETVCVAITERASAAAMDFGTVGILLALPG
ncbi:MAG TPA: hypothetical protein VF459_09645 [Caulobacteraceae bacterium]